MTPIDHTLPAATAPLAAPSAFSNVSQAALAHASPDVRRAKLQKAAAEFESILISTFWKSMKETFSQTDDSSDPAHDSLEDFGIQAMSNALGKAGGLGLGRMILKQLEPQIVPLTNSDSANFGKTISRTADTLIE